MLYDPATGFYDPFDNNRAVIVALWHGEHFLAPLLGRKGDRLTPLVSYHRDGEILARAGRYFGVTYLRGSGDNGKEFMRKKALQAFTGMLRELKSGGSVIVTADVPKISRVAGLGIVTLAKYSQCPILPVAMATSRFIRLSNWDRTCFSLPFGRMALARGAEIRVARDADDAALEQARGAGRERAQCRDGTRLRAGPERLAFAHVVGKPVPTFPGHAPVAVASALRHAANCCTND